MRATSLLLFQSLGLAACALSAHAQAVDAGVTYKCPNRVYSNTMSAKEAKEKGCTVLDNAPVTVIQGNRPRAAPNASPGPAGTRVE